MNTETIILKNESYTVPAEIGGFLIACPVCGKKSNLYDMNEGECPWCQSNIEDTRDRLARILQELDYKIYYECQLESEPRARLILSHLCSFESEPPKHRSSNDPDGRSPHSYLGHRI